MIRIVILTLLWQPFLQSTPPELRGRVTDVTGKPVAGAEVFLTRPERPSAIPVRTGTDGAFSFTLSPGIDYELSAASGGLASRVSAIRASGPGERISIDLKLQPAISFGDQAAKSGIDFVLRNGATGHSYQPEIMLGGVAAFDYDNDGCTDIYFVNGAELPSLRKTSSAYWNRLYRNKCDGTFADVTELSGLHGEGYGMGVAAGDYDNDGFCDLFVTAVNGNRLYRNRGDGTFEDVTARAGLAVGKPMWAVSAGWFDYDNDGRADLFVTNYVDWTPSSDTACRAKGEAFYCHPRVYKGLPNQLFHNNGDGTFTDVSQRSGIASHTGKGMGIAFGDYDNDGFTDVFVANDSVPNFFFRNLGNGKFQESAIASGVAYAANGNAVASMGADFRDFDDDGLDDIAVNAMYFDTFPLFRNQGKTGFVDYTATSGVAIATRNLTGWGMGIFDFDNDGRKDLFYATSHFPGSEPYVHEPAAIPNHVLRNVGAGYFEDVSPQAGEDFQRPGLHHGAAFADFDNDGRVDVVVTAMGERAKLFRNTGAIPANWIALRLDRLGARVKLTLPTGAVRYNHVTRTVGYASSSEPEVRFGLGPYEYVPKIEIRWPGGRVQTLLNIAAGKRIEVKEQ